MTEFTKLTIKSDGTSRNTKILTEDGKMLLGVTDVIITIGLDDEVTATVIIIQPKLELKNVKTETINKKIDAKDILDFSVLKNEDDYFKRIAADEGDPRLGPNDRIIRISSEVLQSMRTELKKLRLK